MVFAVIDTNVFVSAYITHHPDAATSVVVDNMFRGKIKPLYNDEILAEYEEIIGRHMSPLAAKITIEAILRANNTLRVDAQYRFNLIKSDVDDNKFVDCAIVSNADYIVTEDRHFDILKNIPFPKVEIKRLTDFCKELQQS